MATFSFDVQIPPASVNVFDVAAGFGVFRVPLTGLLAGDVVSQMRVAVSIVGGGTTEITITPQLLASGQIVPGVDGVSAVGSFTIDPSLVASIAAARAFYSVRVWVLRAGVTQDREIQTGGMNARAASVSTALNTITSVVASPSAATVAPGSTQQLTAVAKNIGGTVVSTLFAWVSSNTAVATVDANGLVTALANGTAVISATAQGVSGVVTLTVSAFLLSSTTVFNVDGSITQTRSDGLVTTTTFPTSNSVVVHMGAPVNLTRTTTFNADGSIAESTS